MLRPPSNLSTKVPFVRFDPADLMPCILIFLLRTDRILWKGNGIEQLCYRSHPQLQISDHKPVTSLLRSGVKVVDRDKERRVYEEIMKQLDKQENEYLPQVNRAL